MNRTWGNASAFDIRSCLQSAASELALLRNERRAGISEKRFSDVTMVPLSGEAEVISLRRPLSMTSVEPSFVSAENVETVRRETAPIE